MVVKVNKKIQPYLIATIISVLILIWVLQLWNSDLRVPFVYTSDALLNLMIIKGIVDNGWYFHNQFLGAPFSLEHYDYPFTDSFNFLIIKIISVFNSDSAFILNTFFLLTFLLTVTSSLFVFIELKISQLIAVVFAILYAFLPYHFIRGETHIFLSAYYMIPLVTLIILSLWSDNPPFFNRKQHKENKLGIFPLERKSIIVIFVCLISGCTYIYYPLFSCFFILVAGLSSFLYKKDKRILLSSLTMIGLIFSSIFLNLLPTIVYSFANGKNSEVAHRFPAEAEIYGLKIIHLLLPLNSHRFSILRDLSNKYNTQAPLQNENTTATLGIIGSIGFLALLAILIFRTTKQMNIEQRLAVLNISAVLFATIGGFGSVFSFFVSPQIRAVNRISIFIAFFSFLVVALFIDSIKQKYAHKKNRNIFIVRMIFVLLLGIFDQTSEAFVPSYTAIKNEYTNDREFVKEIEQSVPKNSMIFQLPYVQYPEVPPVHKLQDYDLSRGYLHSKNLRWSYGAMKGRYADSWQRMIAQEPTDVFLSKLSAVGFNGIYIDRNGYTDAGKNIEAELEGKLGTKPIVSQNNRLAFFNMKDFNAAFRGKYSGEQIADYRESTLKSLEVVWKKGCYDLEKNTEFEGNWRWCSQKGVLIINNPDSQIKNVTISMSLITRFPEYSNLRFESDILNENIKLNSTPSSFSKTISVPSGLHTVKFITDTKRVDAPLDSRVMHFGVMNFKAVEEGKDLK